MWWDLVCESFWSTVRPRVNPFTPEQIERFFARSQAGIEALEEWAREQRQSEPSRDALDEDERAVQDGMLAALVSILESPDLRCQSAALHGLGHLRHPRGPRVVQDFIDRSPTAREFSAEWLGQCREGSVM
jgi:hypothetical protein